MQMFDLVTKSKFKKFRDPLLIVARLMSRAYIEKGIIQEDAFYAVTEDIYTQLKEAASTSDPAEFMQNMDVPNQFNPVHVNPMYRGKTDLGISIDQSEKEFVQEVEYVRGELKNHYEEYAGRAVTVVSQNWMHGASRMNAAIMDRETEFAYHLYVHWGKGFEWMTFFLEMCYRLGFWFKESVANVKYNKVSDYRVKALLALHAKGCQVANEAFTLLRNGFPSGAQARWRALDELAVFSALISKSDDETAERFLLYPIIEDYELMKSYTTAAIPSGWPQFTPANFNKIQQKVRDLKLRFGDDFERTYGWAAHIIKPAKGNTIRFQDLQGYINNNNFEFARQVSHKSVHATSYDMAFPMDAPLGDTRLYASGTVFGLAGPATLCAQTMCWITANLLNVEEDVSINPTIFLGSLLRVRDRVFEAFEECKQGLKFSVGSRPKRKLVIKRFRVGKMMTIHMPRRSFLKVRQTQPRSHKSTK